MKFGDQLGAFIRSLLSKRMNLLVLTDLDGHEIFINPDHVVYARFPGPHVVDTKGIVHLVNGNDLQVQDTPGQIAYKFLTL